MSKIADSTTSAVEVIQQSSLDQKAGENIFERKTAVNTDTEMGGMADVSAGELEDVLEESGASQPS